MILRDDKILSPDKQIIEIMEQIIMCRPAPIRKYDQIYMKAYDMFNQAIFISELLANRKVVFLGDGDAMSLLFLLLMEKRQIPCAEQLSVLDFDERIINNYKRQFELYDKNLLPHLNAALYNVINPIDEKYKAAYDFFYINPPYGSKNQGRSCMAWIYRCMELCTEHCYGCIILPYDIKLNWTVKNMKAMEQFLLKNGFIIKEVSSNMHQYHLQDNPELTSSAMIVERISNVKSKFENRVLPETMLNNFYGKPRKLPEYIKDNGTIYGLEEYGWIYGQQEF